MAEQNSIVQNCEISEKSTVQLPEKPKILKILPLLYFVEIAI